MRSRGRKQETLGWGVAVMVLFSAGVSRAVEPLAIKPDALGQAILPVEWPENGRLEIKTPAPNIVRAAWHTSEGETPLGVEFNSDATQAALVWPTGTERLPGELRIETAEKSRQWADGRIVFSALDASVLGTRAKLETHAGNHRIGFWSALEDVVAWNYSPTRPGAYSVELTYSQAGPAASRAAVEIAGQTLEVDLPTTSSWYRYATVPVGQIKLPKEGPQALTVKGLKKGGGAVMNLKAVILRPASEGAPPVQAADGVVTLDARDVTVHGINVQYEPQPHKNTVGCWFNPADHVSWRLTLNQPGRFAVEVLQGCGAGQGGSEVDLLIDDQKLRFTVVDTGHFQNFQPRTIGHVQLDHPGPYVLTIQPIKKAKAAVMDVRQVRLVPVEK